ncbi:transglutaminase-like domain-containing protein [Rhodopirellula sp. P2]|uniref:transglutaminase-like domain-containing protein n=1 Tax=Rhodopirellula sp. P2 TaxID=2127060 RepID=UPI002367B644|nr:transglutaminase-like domain-containing protein [Rhodopirellula sp. P2]WDQ15680.1 transglutaminase-like domain-containing protein [Rhodopirellula sp. P2]
MPSSSPMRSPTFNRHLAPLVILLTFPLACLLHLADVVAQTPAETSLSATQQESIDALPKIPSGLNQGFSIVRTPAKRVTATITFEVNTPSLQAKTWVFAMPEPPDLPGQKRIQSTTTPTSEIIADQSVFQRPIRRCRMEVTDESQRRTAKFRCDDELQLFARSLTFDKRATSAKPPVVSLSAKERQNFLRSTPEYDYRSEAFQEWKTKNRFRRLRTEGEVRFAQRVFQKLANSYRYSYVPSEDRTASLLCQSDATDCGGLSTLFATVMRSEGVPARILSGRWAISATPGETINDQPYYQYHVIAEFYAQGVGWIPLDTSSAIIHDRTKTKLQYFGQSDGDFITYHVDPGVKFDTDLHGDYRAAYFQIPLMWVTGQGTLDGFQHQESWTVTP